MKYLISIALFLLTIKVHAQQDPLYAQYLNNPLLLNPAYAGFNNSLNASVGYRQQWRGMDGPKTFNFSADISALSGRGGAGLAVVADRIGPISRNEIMVASAYKIPLSPDLRLSFGLQGGVVQYQIDHSKLSVFDPADPLFDGNENAWAPNIGAGVILSSDRFFAGLSVPRVLETPGAMNNMNHTLSSRHYYLTAGYLIPLSPQVIFKPSAMLRYVSGAPHSLDVNATLVLREKLQTGIFMRNFETLGGLLQFTMKDNFRLGYVFEMPAGDAPLNFVTHEFTLMLRMKALPFHESPPMAGF